MSAQSERETSAYLTNITADEYAVPENVTRLEEISQCQIGTLKLHASFSGVELYCDYSSTVSRYEVAEDNPFLKSVDGAVFSKDGKTLIAYPNAATETHYTVPAGVTAIADHAFANNINLQSVSLPIGLKSIGSSAFYRCCSLISINIPLTVTELGANAFDSCMLLERVSMSSALQASLEAAGYTDDLNSENPFLNCPLLKENAQRTQGNNGAIGDAQSWRTSDESAVVRSVVASPEKSTQTVAIYAYPDEDSDIEREVSSGTILRVDLSQSSADWYAVYSEGEESSEYVLRSETASCPQETLFEYAAVTPKNGKVKVTAIFYSEGTDYEEAEPVQLTWSAFQNQLLNALDAMASWGDYGGEAAEDG